MSYYLIKLSLKKKVNVKVKIILSEIKLIDEFDTIILKNPKFFFDISLDRNCIFLYLKEGEHSFEWYFNEEYDLDLSLLQVIFENENIPFSVEMCDSIEESTLKNNFLKDFINKKFRNNSICFSGLKPNELYGYNLSNKKYQYLATEIKETLIKKIEESNIQICITSCTLGMETVSFFVVDWLKNHGYNLKNVLVIPFKNVSIKWSKSDKDRLERMKRKADYIIYSDTLNTDYNLVNIGEYHQLKYFYCNQFIIDHSAKIIILKNPLSKKNGKSVDYALLNNVEITELYPPSVLI